MKPDRRIDTDVVVIGGGGAALRAAVAAAAGGARTAIVLKGRPGRSGATVSPDSSGVAWQASDECSSDDSPEIHARNIIDAGLGMADPKLARILAEEVLDRMAELERWGMRFIPDPEGRKRHYTGYSCFGDRPRAHGIANSGWGHAGDIVKTLVGVLRRMDNVEIHSDVFVTDLVTVDGECRGALAVAASGEVLLYRAGAVVLVAGGARQIFPLPAGRTPIDTTGDGYAMAFRAGAELANMEFTQYMLAPVKPFPVRCPGSFWKLFPKLRNRLGEEFLSAYLPPDASPEEAMHERTLHYPFSSRDSSKWIDIAIAAEIRAGRGAEGGAVYLDFSEADLKRFTPSRPQHLPEDYSQPIVLPDGWAGIRPEAHAINGGVLIDERASSSLSGLFAAGEVAAGPHGADRLGGGMVTNCQVFGARAGRFAAAYALGSGSREAPPASLEAPLARLRRRARTDPEALFRRLQSAAAEHLMVARTEAGLRSFTGLIEEILAEAFQESRGAGTAGLRRSMELENSLLTARLMARAALLRQESRGSHFRDDYRERDDERWRVSIVFRRRDGITAEELRTLEKR